LGFLFKNTKTILDYNPLVGPVSSSGYVSPWSNSHLAPVLFPNVSESLLPVSAAEALQVPPVTRALFLYSTVAAGLPLVASTGEAEWLSTTEGAVTPAHRTASIIQSLILRGAACLWVERDDEGFVTKADHIPDAWWTVNQDNYIVFQNEVLNQDNFVYIPSLLNSGFLDYGKETIRQYLSICKTMTNRAANPTPLLEIHITDDFEGEPEELEETLANWAAARQSPNGAVAITPKGIELNTPGAQANEDGAMLIAARNAIRLDVANFLNINAAMLDGNNGTSDTYSNTLQNQSELINLSLDSFLKPIESRLSQNDVTRPGITVSFDRSKFDAMPDAKGNTGNAVMETPNV
jgi:hypothetical protein